jgi:hypothetical protein
LEREEASNQGSRLPNQTGRLELTDLAHPLPSVGSVHKAIHVERGVTAKHVVGGTAEASGEDAQGLALPVLGAKSVDEPLAAGVLLKEEDGCLAVGPLEMRVADLVAGGAGDLACRGARGKRVMSCSS